eukprot:c6176_g1_i1.p1 GENE.c6176_g1_i1~~c6176_g1_i1.p1  ORF type:complete len:391 (-),score=96.08 c6176_g1_i1:236-1408(-)
MLLLFSLSVAVTHHVEFLPYSSFPKTQQEFEHVREWVAMTNRDGQRYNCSLPKTADEEAERARSKPKLPDPNALLKQLEETCLFRMEGWWTYEFCWKQQIRQFHAEGKEVVANFVLGVFDANRSKPQVKTAQNVGAQIITSVFPAGTVCDLTNRPRETTVLFVCDAQVMFASIRETATCEYTVTINTPAVCLESSEQSQNFAISCYAINEDSATGAQGTWQEAVELDAKHGDKKLPEILFRPGQCLRHKVHGYRGVIMSSDPTCMQPERWMKRAKVDNLPLGRHQPYYLVLVDERDRPGGLVTYVAQELVILQPQPEPIVHPLTKDIFTEFVGGHYVMRSDVSVNIMPSEEAEDPLLADLLDLARMDSGGLSEVVASVGSTQYGDADEEE